MNTRTTLSASLLLLLTLAASSDALAQQQRRAASANRPAARASAQPAPVRSQPTTVAASRTQSAPAQAAPAARPLAPPRSRLAFSGIRNRYLNAGVGLAAYYGGGLPLGASFEVDVTKNISVGGSFDYLRYRYDSYYSYGYGYNVFYVGARGSYHLGEALRVRDKKFDPYVGASLGYRHTGYSGYDYYGGYGYGNGLFIGLHVGSRYMFSPTVGAFAEVGYGVSALKLGVSAKF